MNISKIKALLWENHLLLLLVAFCLSLIAFDLSPVNTTPIKSGSTPKVLGEAVTNYAVGSCGDNPVCPLTGYKWVADCSDSRKCVINADCLPNSSDPKVDPKTSNWCFGFTNGFKCLKLESTNDNQPACLVSQTSTTLVGVAVTVTDANGRVLPKEGDTYITSTPKIGIILGDHEVVAAEKKDTNSDPFEPSTVLTRLRKAGKISETDQLVPSNVAMEDVLPIIRAQGKIGTPQDIWDVFVYTKYPVKTKKLYFENCQVMNLPGSQWPITVCTAECGHSSDYLSPYGNGENLKQSVPSAYVDKMMTHHLNSGETDPTLYGWTASGKSFGYEEVWDFDNKTTSGKSFNELFDPPFSLDHYNPWGGYAIVVSLIMTNTGGEVPQRGPFFAKYPKGYIPLSLYGSEINIIRNKLKASGKKDDDLKYRPYSRLSCSDGDFLEVNSILPYP